MTQIRSLKRSKWPGRALTSPLAISVARRPLSLQPSTEIELDPGVPAPRLRVDDKALTQFLAVYHANLPALMEGNRSLHAV